MSVQQEFIDLIALGAQECQIASNMFASVTIAQACLETGYNSGRPTDNKTGEDSFNIFGVKRVRELPYVTSVTWEEVTTLPKNYLHYITLPTGKYKVWILAEFAKFESIEHCMMYRARFLTDSPFYEKALSAASPEDAVKYLIHTGHFNGKGEEIGYATDSKYIGKIVDIITRFNLTAYDLTKEEIEMIKELKTAVDILTEKVEALAKENAELKSSVYTVKPVKDQVLAKWAQEGSEFVIGTHISDGTRPQDPITRQEVFTMLERFNEVINNNNK